MGAADRDVNVVKTVRQHSRQHQQVEHSASGEKHIRKIVEVEPSTNFYASNLELGSIPPLSLHQPGRSRWDIDARLFHTLVREGALKQPSLHQGYEKALVVLTMLRVLGVCRRETFRFGEKKRTFLAKNV